MPHESQNHMDNLEFFIIMGLALTNIIFLLCLSAMTDSRDSAKRTTALLRIENEKLANERNKAIEELKDANEHLDMHHSAMVSKAMDNIDVPAMLESILGIKVEKKAPERSPARATKKKAVTVKKAPKSRSEARRTAIQTGGKTAEKQG